MRPAREEARRTQLAQQRATEEREPQSSRPSASRRRSRRRRSAASRRRSRRPRRSRPSTTSRSRATTPAASSSSPSPATRTSSSARSASSHVELIVDGAELAPKLERTLDVSKFGSPVKKVSSFRDRRTPNRVRLVAELVAPAIPTVVRDGNTVRWRFASSAVAQAHAEATHEHPAAGRRWLRCGVDAGHAAVGRAAARRRQQAPHLSRCDRRVRLQGRADPRPAPHHRGRRRRQHRRARHDRRQGHGPHEARAVGPGARGHPRVARPLVPPRGQPVSASRRARSSMPRTRPRPRAARRWSTSEAPRARGRHAQLRRRPTSSSPSSRACCRRRARSRSTGAPTR